VNNEFDVPGSSHGLGQLKRHMKTINQNSQSPCRHLKVLSSQLTIINFDDIYDRRETPNEHKS